MGTIRKSPTQVKGTVVGARLTDGELAFVDIARGERARGTYVADLVREARDKYTKAHAGDTKKPNKA